MKSATLIPLFVLAFTASAEAASQVRLDTIATNQWVSLPELARACAEDVADAREKTAEIAVRLAPGVENALSVTGTYGQVPTNPNPGFPNDRPTSFESYCTLTFRAKAPLDLRAGSLVRKTRLSAGNWDTACGREYDAAAANPNNPLVIYWKSWSLIQGRMCEVTAVQVKSTQE